MPANSNLPSGDDAHPQTQPSLTGGSRPPGGGDRPVATGGTDEGPDRSIAAQHFDRARQAHNTGNHQHAMASWLDGLRLDASSVHGLEGFFRSAAAYLDQTDGKGQPCEELQQALSKPAEINIYLSALLNWAMNPLDPACAVRCADLAASRALNEPGRWIALRAFHSTLRCRASSRKVLFLQLELACNTIGADGLARDCNLAAQRTDPPIS